MHSVRRRKQQTLDIWSLPSSPRAFRGVFVPFRNTVMGLPTSTLPFPFCLEEVCCFQRRETTMKDTVAVHPQASLVEWCTREMLFPWGWKRRCSQGGGWIIQAFIMSVTLPTLFWALTEVHCHVRPIIVLFKLQAANARRSTKSYLKTISSSFGKARPSLVLHPPRCWRLC